MFVFLPAKICFRNATFKGHNLEPFGFLGLNFLHTRSFKDDIRVGENENVI